MNQVVQKPPTGPVAISGRWAKVPRDNTDLSQGVALSFPILAIGTNQWVVRWKGEDRLVKIPNTEYPAPFVDVVILKAQKDMSRVFYASGYVQGVRGKKPDCWSSDGVRPDEAVAQPINSVCATCPNAQWGSGGSPAAPKAQACQQRRRTVVVPYNPQPYDLTNEVEGGPMLLSVPPGSLTNLVRYSEQLNEMELADGSKGMPYAACVTRLSYEPLLKFSKVVFQYMKPLDDAESDVIIALQDAEAVNRILQSKINIDGGEVDHADGGAGGTSQVAPPRPSQGVPRQGAPAQPAPASTVKPTAPAGTEEEPEAEEQHAPPPPPKAAPKAPPQEVKVGGHGITEAVAKPATPPPSTRTVAAGKPAQPAPHRVTAPVNDETVDEVTPPPAGSVADKMSAMFDKLMGE
jgi:hypothetical protein